MEFFRTFQPFSDDMSFEVIENQKKSIVKAINNESNDYILNVNEEEYIKHMVSKFEIHPLQIHKDRLTLETYEADLPAEDFSINRYQIDDFHESQQYYRKDIIKYYLPFTGEPWLLRVRPATHYVSPPTIFVEDDSICFEIINFDFTAEEIKNKESSVIEMLETSNNRLTAELSRFNATIADLVATAFNERKKHLLEKDSLIASLKVPIRKTSDTKETFSVPAKRTKIIHATPKPVVTEKGYKPEPTLDDSIYIQILSVIRDVGKQFERLPSTYQQKKEEDLRDHILLILEPNFEGAATGETFNKSGKTDILLRHEGKNIFIAELKYWTGEKSYLNTITQLLTYLTWRDSKTAVVVFVKNKNFSSVLDTVKKVTPNHTNYLGFVAEPEEGWCRYRFHINEDKNREVQLSVMLFHIPSGGSDE